MPPEPVPARIGPLGWLRVLRRGLPLAALVFGGLGLLLGLRLIERPLFGLQRPITPGLTRLVCRGALWVMGLHFLQRGQPQRGRGALVSNHASWLDIFALNAATSVYFVSKSEVARWPGIGWLARATGTVFIDRDPRQAKVQTALFEARLLAGHLLLFFPEGTSTDNRVVLPFKTTLFAAFFSDALRHEMQIQPVSIFYKPAEGQDIRFYGWWGDMDFGSHLLQVLAAPRHGRVEVTFHEPLRVDAFPNRKSLARHAEQVVRAGHASAMAGTGLRIERP